MAAIIDLTGQKYGHLTVIEQAGRKNGRIAWLCECECGNKTIVTSNALRTGNTKSCGCSLKYRPTQEDWLTLTHEDEVPLGRAENLKGQKFGRLTALYRAKVPETSKAKHEAFWKCQCDCGNMTTVIASALKNGTSQSCGCLQKELLSQRTIKPITIGTRFDHLTVLRELPNRNKHKQILYECQCDCGKFRTVPGNELRRGNAKSCGCVNGQSEEELQEDEVLLKWATDLRGKKFGKLTVLYRTAPLNNDRKPYWKCQCECGNITIVSASCLLSGNTKSCGCLIHDTKPSNLIKPGERFGMLTILNQEQSKNGKTQWKCQCDCGNIVIKDSNGLRSGNTKSCGCLKSLGEQKIHSILQNNNLLFVKEKTFKDCISNQGGNLYFDFYINNQYLIEYDGIQHFQSVGGWSNKDKVLQNQKRDKIKNEYCKTHNIPLIRIPYTHYDKITIDDLRPETSQFLVT